MINFGHGVSLTKVTKDDISRIMNERNHHLLRSNSRQNDIIQPEEQELWYERQMFDSTIKTYVINNNFHEKVGVCSLSNIDQFNRNAEFSINIYEDHQKNGYGTQGLKTLFNHGFNNLNLHQIWGETFEGNHAAYIFEMLGMILDGTRRKFYFKRGRMIDSHLYSIIFEEFREMPYYKTRETIAI